MTNSSHPPVLRHVLLHTQPRTLKRPGCAPSPMPDSGTRSPAPKRLELAPMAPAIDSCIEVARAEARSEGYKEGCESGYQSGLAQGLADAEKRVDAAVKDAVGTLQARAEREAGLQERAWAQRLERLDGLMNALGGMQRDHLDGLTEDAVALAFESVCRILGDSSDRRRIVGDLVRSAIAKLHEQPLRIRVAAADLALLATEGLDDLRCRYPGVEWVADERVLAGGCLVEGAAGTLDARLDQQMQRLLDAWKSTVPEAR